MTISPIDRRTCVTICVTLSIIQIESTAQQIIPFNLIQITTSYDTLEDGSIDTVDSTPHVFIFGSTQLSSSEEVFSSVSASGKFQAMILPLDRFGFTVAYNAFGVNPNTIAKDSLDVPSLVFPDAGNTGFMVSAFYTKVIGKKEQIPKQSLTRLTHYVEFSLRNTKLNTSYQPDYRNEIEEDTLDEYNDDEYYDDEETTTDETLNFTSRNLNIGTRLDWLYASKS